MLYDRIIIGAGIYGLYAAHLCGQRGERVLVLEQEPAAFARATTINQARVHMGYHYPRSLSTAQRSANYFERFVHDFKQCIKKDFLQVYATSRHFSWTDAQEFLRFCQAADIPCEPVLVEKYFREGMCDGAFLTREYTFDAPLLCRQLMEGLGRLPNVEIRFSTKVCSIEQKTDHWKIKTQPHDTLESPRILNAGYASVNEINQMANFPSFSIKYELCEIILCEVDFNLKPLGITVMDGPFFSIMPFGCSGLHSLTSVTFTPHRSCESDLPVFPCQEDNEVFCLPKSLGNCNHCPTRPASAWGTMSQLARKYLQSRYSFSYHSSLFSMKPILKSSEIDDSRPTLVRVLSQKPQFISVLSGKINTIYDLAEVL